MKNARQLKIVKETTEKFLELLHFEAKIDVSEDKENQATKVQIETPDSGVLIGYHGQTLSAFQLILGIIVSKKLGEWERVILNVGDYRQKREEALKRIALQAAQRAHFSGEPVILTSLSSFERRIIHLALSNHPEVETSSEGEGRERRLVVKPHKTG